MTRPRRSLRAVADVIAIAGATLAVAATPLFIACPAPAATPLTTIRVASGLTRPLYVTAPPGDTSRVFIVEQRGTDNRGRIKILKNGVVLSKPFLTTAVLSTGDEQGLLGLAFGPDFADSGFFYINYTDAGGTTRIARHRVSAGDPDVADSIGTVILSIAQPFANHNGGWMTFGPDGYLYISSGDGGSGGDPGDRAQNLNTLLGKMLRIDVRAPLYAIPPDNPYVGAPGLDEIWAYGLRNPWRGSFDRETGDFWLADVGQGTWEEVNYAPAGTAAGRNYGWKCYEGDQPFGVSTTNPCGTCLHPSCPLTFPIHVYNHSSNRCSVTGGYVYRGCAIPDLRGTYFFADFCCVCPTAPIYSGRLSAAGDTLVAFTDRTAQLAPGGGLAIDHITSFGEDARGELYICDRGGEVYKIVPAAPVAEADMPLLLVQNAAGSILGSTSLGNAVTIGITPFADVGSRIAGVGNLENATLLDCPVVTGTTLASSFRLGAFEVDLTASVEGPDSTTLVRTFVFTNRSIVAQDLEFVDVLAPDLDGGSDDLAARIVPAGGDSSAALVVFDTTGTVLRVRTRGWAQGAAFSADVDTASELVARVAADQPLEENSEAGPARTAMALGFDFGSLAPGGTATVTIVTTTAGSETVDVPPPLPPGSAGRVLRLAGPMPFRGELRLSLELPHAAEVTVDVHDAQGRRLQRVLGGDVPAGSHALVWDGRDSDGRSVPAGVYFVRATVGERSESLQVVRLP